MKGQTDIIFLAVGIIAVVITLLIGWYLYMNVAMPLYQEENKSLSPTTQGYLSDADQSIRASFSLLDYLLVIFFFSLYFVVIILAYAVGAMTLLLIFAIFDFIAVIFISSLLKEITMALAAMLSISTFPAIYWFMQNFVIINLVMAFLTILISGTAIFKSR